ncbi:MAG: aspartate kinase [Chitinophagaceae bacterium]|nr:MAG: aspartate kinase [Chitinophagaceae bacterium]
MKVFKFGGASISTIEGYRNVASIIKNFSENNLLVVISAMGKTTNALEQVINAYTLNETQKALDLFKQIKDAHNFLAQQLLKDSHSCIARLTDFYTEVEWLVHDYPVKEYDYYYDQIVCIGEMLSTTIMSYYLNEINIKTQWIDVRDIIRTDDNFRDANIDWSITAEHTKKIIESSIQENTVTITQGFVGATDENESTTLGREGSDYTAAVFANLLNAESQTIWKDVASVMNGDPKEISNTIPIPELNYDEVIEMAYYGAQVIHPTTIKPLYTKNIPLYVKCFFDINLPGTVIHNGKIKSLPPIIVLKKDMVMIEFKTADYSFIGESNTTALYQLFEKYNLRPRLTQNGAINIMGVFDNKGDKIQQLAAEAAQLFTVNLTSQVQLLTIRHYNDDIIQQYIDNKNILVEQKTPQTLLVAYL